VWTTLIVDVYTYIYLEWIIVLISITNTIINKYNQFHAYPSIGAPLNWGAIAIEFNVY